MNFLKKVILTILTLSVITSLSLALIGCPPAKEVVEEPTPTEETTEEIEETTTEEKIEVGKKIAFTSDRDGNAEIYVMNADGSEQINLTNNPANDWRTAFSNDGKKIEF